jgi:putative flippase GtrA
VSRLREVVVYGAGAAAAFAVDVALLAAQVEWLGVHYLLAATLSFIAGTAVVYAVSVRFAFAYRRIDRAPMDFAAFAALGGIGIMFNLGVLFIAVQGLQMHYLLAKVSAAGVTFFPNNASRRALLFTPAPGKRMSQQGNGE